MLFLPTKHLLLKLYYYVPRFPFIPGSEHSDHWTGENFLSWWVAALSWTDVNSLSIEPRPNLNQNKTCVLISCDSKRCLQHVHCFVMVQMRYFCFQPEGPIWRCYCRRWCSQYTILASRYDLGRPNFNPARNDPADTVIWWYISAFIAMIV